MDRLELLEQILKAKKMSLTDLVNMLREHEKPNAYKEAFFKNSGETEEHFRATEKVLGLEEGTLYDRTKLSTRIINRDKKTAAEASKA